MAENFEIRCKCADCMSDIPYTPNIRYCPFCGSENINISSSIHETIKFRTRLHLKAKDNQLKKSQKLQIEIISGSEHSHCTESGFVHKIRIIDKINNNYYEHVADENGTEIHHCQEKLSKHIEHGSAKKNNNKI